MAAPYNVRQLKELHELIELGRYLGARDEIVRNAVFYGISRHTVYIVTGLARTTIDRIMEGDGDELATDALTDDVAPPDEGPGTPDGR